MQRVKVIAAGAALVATAAIAQPPATPTSQASRSSDPNKIVCVNQRVVGSRLNTQRVCRTRAEWEDHRADARREVEESQYFKPTFCGPVSPC